MGRDVAEQALRTAQAQVVSFDKSDLL